MARYEHSGNAQDAHLIGNLTNTGLGLTIDNATGWPTGSTGKFWVAIDPDTASEEHVLVNTRTSTALTIASIGDRGLEGTAPVAHTTGAVVRHIFSATEASDMALQSAANTFTAAQTFLSTITADGNITADNDGSGKISLGNVGGGSAAGIGVDANNYFGAVASNIWALTIGGTRVWQASATELKSLAPDVYFGANALGGAGTRVHLGSLGDAANAYVVAESSGTNAGLILKTKGTATGSASAVIFKDGADTVAAYISSPNGLSTDDTTLVLGRQQGASFTLQRVTEGAADSGGTGKRALVVPN